ncbi:cell wall metabolism sensor histidine kinase WalK [Aeromicrobium sp. 9AM]|uniref:sensor histidine kinase n=1 Tax=Aeromicrobium sp. 9AM TaxID=2653126 RepID=UPI0012F3CB03|nr:HAMP domain-containing sensor histidine kinase [Aeromicrobium sp. 9AM]VXC45150.1 Signal transduction histidine-protein kinase/phosphatase MprB [Aeromicrobium sp. 9AM]
MIDLLHRSLQPFTQRMTLALRVAVLTTMAVAATLGVVSAIVFVVVRAEFERSLDDSMLRRAHAAVDADLANPAVFNQLNPQLQRIADVQIFVVNSGELFSPTTPVNALTKPFKSIKEIEVSNGEASQSMRTVRIQGTPYRVVAVQGGSGTALVMTQSMESIDYALERLKVILLLCSAAGVALAGMAGWAVAANGLRPVRRLTAATERVARTSDLTPIEVTGHDELARLTTSFNAMLQALDASQTRQRQLVADAGHELRTPLTSLRTNIELIGQAADNAERSLTDDQRHEIMGDVRSQLEELTTLVGDLVELARDEPLTRDPEPLDVSDVVTQAIDRVRLRAHTVTFDVELESWMAFGEPQLLERAVTNLLDNAAKWSPPDGTVTVRLADGALTVTDEGPGIDPADLPHIFDRFYRSSEARTLPGSGLGLSIVKRAAERHGGTVDVESAPGGGTTFTLVLPSSDQL